MSITTTPARGAALYDLANARDILDGWLAEHDGELTPELEQLLEELDGKADEKIERVALYIREQLALGAAIKEEEARLAARRKARERAAESLKRYLEQQMERLGKDKVAGLLCTVALQNNPPSVKGELSQEELAAMAAQLPNMVRLIPASYVLEKRAVLDGWKCDGECWPGLTVEQTRSLRIR